MDDIWYNIYMIYFSDITINECNGEYSCVNEKMSGFSDWMIKTTATIVSSGIGFSYIMHFRSDRDIYIMDSNRSVANDSPDDDLREFHNWVKLTGWNMINIHKRLLMDPRDRDFWHRMYLTGLVTSEELKLQDQIEMSRLQNIVKAEED